MRHGPPAAEEAELKVLTLRKTTCGNRIALDVLAACGFAPTLPTGCTWAREGVRLLPFYGPLA